MINILRDIRITACMNPAVGILRLKRIQIVRYYSWMKCIREYSDCNRRPNTALEGGLGYEEEKCGKPFIIHGDSVGFMHGFVQYVYFEEINQSICRNRVENEKDYYIVDIDFRIDPHILRIK